MTQRDPFIKLKPPTPPLTVWAVWDRGHGGTTQSSKSAPYLRDVDRRRRNRWRVVKKNGLPQTHSSLRENLYLTQRNEAAIRTEESGFAEEKRAREMQCFVLFRWSLCQIRSVNTATEAFPIQDAEYLDNMIMLKYLKWSNWKEVPIV